MRDEELVDDLDVGAARHEERDRVGVVGGRSRVRERAGVLVDAEQHHARLERRERDAALPRISCTRIEVVAPTGIERSSAPLEVALLRRMVVVDDDLDARSAHDAPELADPVRDRACRP